MNPLAYHNIFGSVRWRLTPRGVEVEGAGVERTPGEPRTITNIWQLHRNSIEKAANTYSVPVEYILATIAVESGGRVGATREEPGYISDEKTPNRVSAGLMQTLISTAATALSVFVTREWLLIPENSIMAGTKYIKDQSGKSLLDGPLVFAAYNAGGVYRNDSPDNRWKVRQFPIGTSAHCDRAIKWLNDAVSVTLGGEVVTRGWSWFLKSLLTKKLP